MTLGKFNIVRLRFRCAVFLLICASVSIQQTVAQQLLWKRVFDGGNEDYANDVAIDSKGNIIVVGNTVPGEIEPNDHGDIFTIKYNPQGDTIWTRRFDSASEGNSSDNATAIAVDNQDNIYVAGSIWQNTNVWPCCIVKYGADGTFCWIRMLSNDTVTVTPAKVVIDSRCNLIITGQNKNSDYQTVKYDSNGILLWMRIYNGGYEDNAQDVTVDDSDNVIVTGYSDSNINWDWCTIKYTPDGDTLWVRRYDVAKTDWAFGVTTDRQGNVIVVGESHYFYPGSGGSSGMVVKYTPQGDTLWTKMFTDTFQYAEVGKFVDVTTDDQGNIYLAGDYFHWDSIGNNRTDYYVAKCDGQGDTLWTFLFNYDNEDEVSGIALDRSGNAVVTGSTNHSYGWYEQNFLTIKIKDIVNLVVDDHPLPRKFILYPNYPNPFNPMTTIEFTVPGTLHVVLKVYNLLGQELETLVDERKATGTYTIRWNATRYASGVYIARLTAGTFMETKKMLLLR